MSRTHYIFVDFENVQETDWDRIAGKLVKVVLVLGANQKSLPFEFVRFLHQRPHQVELIKTTRTGRNALDFVLSARLGEIRGTDPDGSFHIVSKDTGFDALVDYLKGSGSLAGRHASLAEIFPKSKDEERIAKIEARLKIDGNNRPKQLNSLRNLVRTGLGGSASEAQVDEAIQRFVEHKVIRLLDSGEVKYAA